MHKSQCHGDDRLRVKTIVKTKRVIRCKFCIRPNKKTWTAPVSRTHSRVWLQNGSNRMKQPQFGSVTTPECRELWRADIIIVIVIRGTRSSGVGD